MKIRISKLKDLVVTMEILHEFTCFVKIYFMCVFSFDVNEGKGKDKNYEVIVAS